MVAGATEALRATAAAAEATEALQATAAVVEAVAARQPQVTAVVADQAAVAVGIPATVAAVVSTQNFFPRPECGRPLRAFFWDERQFT